MKRPAVVWKCREHTLHLGAETCVMGIVNVTPDSFSDGGRFLDVDHAVEHGRALKAQGVHILDIGGESTRPGAAAVSVEEECDRVLPVLKQLCQEDILISIDTTKAVVAERALELGAHIINDVTGLQGDPAMQELACRYGSGVVVMHMQGSPRTMQENPEYVDVVGEIHACLQERVDRLAGEGLAPEQLCIDPGIGFGKTLDHNLELLRRLPEFHKIGRPVLLGLSRKRFLGSITGKAVSDRRQASLAAMAYAITRGAHVMRVHDGEASVDTANVIDALIGKED